MRCAKHWAMNDLSTTALPTGRNWASTSCVIFPGGLEAVVLDGANSLSRKSWVEDRALDAQWGIDNLTRLCSEDPVCRASFDIPAPLETAIALFDDGPLPFRYPDPSDPAMVVEGDLKADDLVTLVYEMQGSRIGAYSLPATLQILSSDAAEQTAAILGQRRGSELLASRDSSAESGMAKLIHTAMVCSDDPAMGFVMPDGTISTDQGD